MLIALLLQYYYPCAVSEFVRSAQCARAQLQLAILLFGAPNDVDNTRMRMGDYWLTEQSARVQLQADSIAGWTRVCAWRIFRILRNARVLRNRLAALYI